MSSQTPDDMHEVHTRTRHAYNLAAQEYHDLFHDEMNQKEYDRNLLDGYARRFGHDSLVCDAGCGPSAQIGRYVFEQGVPVVGVDISDRCTGMARRHNPGMGFVQADIAEMPFAAATLDGIIAYYSVIDTPKRHVGRIFREFWRTLKPGGLLLVAVKSGTGEGHQKKGVSHAIPPLLFQRAGLGFLPLDVNGVGERKRRVKELFEQVGLGDGIEHEPSEMSGGQMQCVAVARVPAWEPDEPTGKGTPTSAPTSSTFPGVACLVGLIWRGDRDEVIQVRYRLRKGALAGEMQKSLDAVTRAIACRVRARAADSKLCGTMKRLGWEIAEVARRQRCIKVASA